MLLLPFAWARAAAAGGNGVRAVSALAAGAFSISSNATLHNAAPPHQTAGWWARLLHSSSAAHGGGGLLDASHHHHGDPHHHHHHHAAAPHASAARARATTILCVRRGGEVVMMGDGQATQDAFIVKRNVRKVRLLAGSGTGGGGGVIGGFAGRAADGLSLLERLEAKLAAHPGQLRRAAVELAKDWRQDRVLRNLDALLLVADASTLLWLSGTGDVIEASDGVMAIGSGGDYAEAAARALLTLPGQTAMGVAHRAMRIAADSCVYTNHSFTWQQINGDGTLSQGVANDHCVTPAAEAAADEEPA